MKPTINEIEKAKQIVNDLIKEDFFDAIICESNDNFFSWCCDHEDFLKGHIKVYCGETKACIISDKLPNWVIKVGFTYSDEIRGVNETVDFCAIEARNFKDALAEGLEEFFAATYKLCELTPPEEYEFEDNISFFIQEKAMPDEEKTSSTCAKYTGSEWNEDLDRLESLFGKNKKFKRLFNFITDWSIDDLHSGNFGYTPNGQVKIIDYSGF